MTSWRARLGWGALIAAVAAVTTSGAAVAHSALVRSDPADGARLHEAPKQVVLEFSEPPDPDLSSVEMFDGAGEPVDVGALTPSADDSSVVQVALPPLDDDAYTVSWRTLSAVDGHVASGAFSFVVGDVPSHKMAPAPMEMDEQPGPGATGVAGRWLLYAGLALLLGWAMSVLVIFRARHSVSLWTLVGCWLLAVVGLALVTVSEADAIDASVAQLLSSSAGERLVRSAVLLAALGLGVVAAAYVGGRIPVAVVAILTASTMYAHVAAGHAGAPGSDHWLNLSSQWLHLVAIGTWVGGLGWLLVGTRRQRSGEAPSPDAAAAFGRFSTLATVCIGGVVVTGVVRAVDEVGSVDALASTGYGQALLVKIGLVAMLATLGALNRFSNVPAIRRGRAHVGRLRRTVRGEVVFAAAVFGVVGVMANLPPPAGTASHHEGAGMAETGADEGIEVSGSDFATTMRVTLRIDPGMVGENHFTVQIADYDTGEPLDAVRVALRLAIPDQPGLGPAMLELRSTSDGQWEGAGTALSQPHDGKRLSSSRSRVRVRRCPWSSMWAPVGRRTIRPSSRRAKTASAAGLPAFVRGR